MDAADPVIWIDPDLLSGSLPLRPARLGGIEIQGDLVSFGTPGEGLGRLTYRLTGRTSEGWTIAERVGP